MKKIIFTLGITLGIIACGVESGADSMKSSADSSVESSAKSQQITLPQRVEYNITEIVVGGKALKAVSGATFGIDGVRIYGNTGCNGYFGDIKRIGGGDVEIAIVGSTRMMCDEVANKFERVLLSNLAGRFSVSKNGGVIILTNGNAQIKIRQ